MMRAGLMAKPMLSLFWSNIVAPCWMYIFWSFEVKDTFHCDVRGDCSIGIAAVRLRGRKRRAWRKRKSAESRDGRMSGTSPSGCDTGMDEKKSQSQEYTGRKVKAREREREKERVCAKPQRANTSL